MRSLLYHQQAVHVDIYRCCKKETQEARRIQRQYSHSRTLLQDSPSYNQWISPQSLLKPVQNNWIRIKSQKELTKYQLYPMSKLPEGDDTQRPREKGRRNQRLTLHAYDKPD